jgi:hypothetical protein
LLSQARAACCVFWGNPLAQFSLRKEAKNCSIAGKRLFFANNLPKPKHLVQKQLTNFALDTAHSILALEKGFR